MGNLSLEKYVGTPCHQALLNIHGTRPGKYSKLPSCILGAASNYGETGGVTLGSLVKLHGCFFNSHLHV